MARRAVAIRRLHRNHQLHNEEDTTIYINKFAINMQLIIPYCYFVKSIACPGM